MELAENSEDNSSSKLTELEALRKVISQKQKTLNALTIELAHLKQREKELKQECIRF